MNDWGQTTPDEIINNLCSYISELIEETREPISPIVKIISPAEQEKRERILRMRVKLYNENT